MPHRFIRRLILALVVWLAGVPAMATDWRDIPQPSGAFVGDGIYSPATINVILGGIPPFDSGTDVTLIRTGLTHQYVRFYNPADPVNPSNAIGSWVMRASEVRGLTIAQIRDRFALPAVPTHIVQVLVPEGYALYTGEAAPIATWGHGGGTQNRLMANRPPVGVQADPWLEAANYRYAQPLDDAPVLSYRTAIPAQDNAARMGAYMDGLSPRPYSDLDDVYNALDTMFLSGQKAFVAQAMQAFSPERYDALTQVAQRVAMLRSAVLDSRTNELLLARDQERGVSGHPILLAMNDARTTGLLSGRTTSSGWNVWLRGGGEYLRDSSVGHTPFSAGTAAVHIGADRDLSPDLTMGLDLGLARTLLDWEQDGGDSAVSTLNLAMYALWVRDGWFVSGELGGDLSLIESQRRIRTDFTDRAATAEFTGQGLSLRARAGRRLSLGDGVWRLTPAVEIGYGINRREAFTEHGAGDLDLDVRESTSQTLRLGADLNLGRRIVLDNGGVLEPEAGIGWLRETPLDKRDLRAGFSGYSERFTTYGDDQVKDNLRLSAGLTHSSPDGTIRYARYAAILRENFQAHSLEAGCCWRF